MLNLHIITKNPEKVAPHAGGTLPHASQTITNHVNNSYTLLCSKGVLRLPNQNLH